MGLGFGLRGLGFGQGTEKGPDNATPPPRSMLSSRLLWRLLVWGMVGLSVFVQASWMEWLFGRVLNF